jgi:uncharacterized membrane protein YphA (DoxX/SURF4 family)
MTAGRTGGLGDGVRRWWRVWAYEAYATDGRSLAIVRIAYGLYVLVVAGACTGRLAWVAHMPPSFFDPPLGPMRAFAAAPSELWVHAICLASYVAAAAVLLGYRTVASSILLTCLLLLGNGFSYSFAKINHSAVMATVPLLLALAGWGTRYSVDGRRDAGGEVRAWPIALLALGVGVAMFAGGLPKLLGGWWDPGTQATRLHMIRHFVTNGPLDLLAPVALRLPAGALWEAADRATLIAELGLLPAVLFPRLFRALLAVFVVFHVNVLLLFNIAFSGHMLVYAPFANWSRMIDRLPRKTGPQDHRRGGAAWRAIGAVVVLGVLAYLVPSTVRGAVIPGGTTVRVADFAWISLAGAITALFCLDAIGRSWSGARGTS